MKNEDVLLRVGCAVDFCPCGFSVLLRLLRAWVQPSEFSMPSLVKILTKFWHLQPFTRLTCVCISLTGHRQGLFGGVFVHLLLQFFEQISTVEGLVPMYRLRARRSEMKPHEVVSHSAHGQTKKGHLNPPQKSLSLRDQVKQRVGRSAEVLTFGRSATIQGGPTDARCENTEALPKPALRSYGSKATHALRSRQQKRPATSSGSYRWTILDRSCSWADQAPVMHVQLAVKLCIRHCGPRVNLNIDRTKSLVRVCL